MNAMKPSKVLSLVRKKAAEEASGRNYLDKLPSVNTADLYKDQSKSIYEGYKELNELDKDARKANKLPGQPDRSSNNTPGFGAKAVPPIEAPELTSPQYSVAPPTGNVFPNERPVNVSQDAGMDKKASRYPVGFGLRGVL